MGTPSRRPIEPPTLSNPRNNVFINCPYDAAYRPLFDAVFLAVVACEYTPRSAMESGTVSISRIDRIRTALFGSAYSIHDLSRSQGEGDSNLARFNMPLELGFAMARRFLDESSHDWAVLVPEGHQYLSYISDLGPFDPLRYRGTVETVVPVVINWLQGRPDTSSSPYPDKILARLPAYMAELTRLRARSGGELAWWDMHKLARRHASVRQRRANPR